MNQLAGSEHRWLYEMLVLRSLMQAAQFVQVIEERQGLRIGCIEEVAWKKGYITTEQLETLAQPLIKSGYGEYLMKLIERG